MTGEPAGSPIVESTATLRASGASRYFDAAFLAVWLAGWAVGEVVVLGVFCLLIAALLAPGQGWPLSAAAARWLSSGPFSLLVLFVLLWLTFWTIGGVSAISHSLRSVAGEDRLRLLPAGLELRRRAGPFRRVRTFERAAIRGIRIRLHDQALVADTLSGTELLTDLGTTAERNVVCRWLRNYLQIEDHHAATVDTTAAPPGWDVRIDEGSDTRLSRRAHQWRPVQALVLWLVTGLVSLGWITSVRAGTLNAGSITTFVLTLLLGAGSAWLTLERSEWLAGPGRLAFRRRFGPWLFEQRFENARLEVERSTDSDGDDQYRLVVRDETSHRTVLTAVNDEREVVDCARWLAARTGFPVSLPGLYAMHSMTGAGR